MSENIILKGSCQCGGISYQINSASVLSVACHCDDCRKLSGSAFGTSLVIKSEDVQFSGTFKTWERRTDTGRRNIAYFCPDCGNRIYHQDPDTPVVVRLRSGTLDDDLIPEPSVHVFAARKMPWLTFPEHVILFEGQPDADELYAALATAKPDTGEPDTAKPADD